MFRVSSKMLELYEFYRSGVYVLTLNKFSTLFSCLFVDWKTFLFSQKSFPLGETSVKEISFTNLKGK